MVLLVVLRVALLRVVLLRVALLPVVLPAAPQLQQLLLLQRRRHGHRQ